LEKLDQRARVAGVPDHSWKTARAKVVGYDNAVVFAGGSNSGSEFGTAYFDFSREPDTNETVSQVIYRTGSTGEEH